MMYYAMLCFTSTEIVAGVVQMCPKRLPKRLVAALTLHLQACETKLGANPYDLYVLLQYPGTSRIALWTHFLGA